MIALLLGWEPWKDVMVFNYLGTAYVLQVSRHRLTRSLRFQCKAAKAWWNTADTAPLTKEHLEAVKSWEPTPSHKEPQA